MGRRQALSQKVLKQRARDRRTTHLDVTKPAVFPSQYLVMAAARKTDFPSQYLQALCERVTGEPQLPNGNRAQLAVIYDWLQYQSGIRSGKNAELM